MGNGVETLARWKYYLARVCNIRGDLFECSAFAQDPDEDARSDEDFDDEELILDENTLEIAMKTRVGGTEKEHINEATDLISGKNVFTN